MVIRVALSRFVSTFQIIYIDNAMDLFGPQNPIDIIVKMYELYPQRKHKQLRAYIYVHFGQNQNKAYMGHNMSNRLIKKYV